MLPKEKAFAGFRHNGFHLNFPNGNRISTIWGVGSYTENHDIGWKKNKNGKFKFLDLWNTFLESNDVEIMFDCGEKLYKKIHKKYKATDNSVIGHLNIMEWLDILNQISRQRKRSK